MIEKDAKEIARIIHEECFIDTSHSEKPYFVWDIDVATNVIQFALDAYAKAKLEEAADKAIKWVLSFGVVGSQEM
ncbi:MAG: hypothetical protein M0P47_12955, partial [Bacteroidales bacterium]|nr:hypothetical protein [Bacteroidales bacterium]